MGFFSKKQKAPEYENIEVDDAQSSPSQEKKKEPTFNNPYFNGRREWLERYGSYINRASQWRFFAFLCMIVTGISITGNVLQALQVKAIPYIVEVDKLGRSAMVSRAEDAREVPIKLIQADIAASITAWRTVTADLELQKQMIQKLTYYVAGSARGVLREYYEANNPYLIAKSGKLIQVTVDSLPLPLTNDTYRVEWTETTRNHKGIVLDKTSYQATVSIQIVPPENEEVMLHNPGGVYITSLSASKIFAPNERKK